MRMCFGVRRGFRANCSGSALRSRSRPLPNTWPREAGRLARPGHLSAQPCTSCRCRGPVRRSNHWLQSALCPGHRAAGAARSCLDQCHIEPDRGMDRAPDHGGIPLGRGPAIFDPRPGRSLRRRCYPSTAGDGHPRQAHCARLALAKQLCGEANRIDPSRMR